MVSAWHAQAAQLCAARVLGFDCMTLHINRRKFESPTFIENRVAMHAVGELSGVRIVFPLRALERKLIDGSGCRCALMSRKIYNQTIAARALANSWVICPL